ncbi:DNA damage-induced apoptosis suppressor protein [Lates calcarifer]|uniref:DNA damage-induced apoptosis suppressor protein n=1 Tax=Lates calcarifer TaxID=8187 RepID=A0AAJ7LIA5_LATCA|nr:DNA damage-induced apoptosis suppressor protein [Lates calcarifer]
MSVRRALVDCAVLSVQDACVFYPCCKGCFSRIDVEQQDSTRCKCFKCGYRCLRERVDYRYRLSLRVARDRCIFGVTVFGTCLNPFFGIDASGLQRLVENLEGPVGASTRAKLLVKAVEDCFIGRHFIFGIKVTGAESGLCFGEPAANGSSSKDTVQFIASQMILPNAAGLRGCTVVSYYRILLQRAAEYEQGSTDPSKSSRPPETLLLIPHCSSGSSFSNATFSASGLLSQSPQRSQHQGSNLTPTPPWQQSLGLITSSAEQEEDCSTQDSGGENSQQTDNNKTPHNVPRGCLGNHKATMDSTLSPLLSFKCNSYNSPSFAKYPHTSFEKAVRNTPILDTWFSPSQPRHKNDLPVSYKAKECPTRRLTKTLLSSSLAWEDLPFSESLTAFLCEENKDSDIVSKTEPHVKVQNQETVRNNLEARSQDKSIQSTSVCQSDTELTESHSWMLLDITNTPPPNCGGDRHDLSDSVGCVNKGRTRSISSHQEDDEASSLSFEDKEEEQLEGDTYNCSADLFSSSFIIDSNTKNTHAETVRMTTEACPLISNLEIQYLRSEKPSIPHSTPDKQKLESNKCINRDSLIPPDTQDLDFIPPAQSTPIIKVADVSESPAPLYSSSQPDTQDVCAFYSDLPELDSKMPAKITSSLCIMNTVSATRLPQCGRGSTKENLPWSMTSSSHNHRFTPKRRFWKPNKHKIHQLAEQHLRAQRGALILGSTVSINQKCDSSVCDVTVCDYEDSAVVVPPTPAAKTRLSAKLRRQRQTDNSRSNFDSTWETQQEDGVNCKRNLLDHHPSLLTSSKRGLDGSDGYLPDDENQACDWSRDLFSDSA